MVSNAFPGIDFNDTASVASTAISGTIICSPEPLESDPHCTSGYTGDQLTGVTLEMFDREDSELRNSYVPRTVF